MLSSNITYKHILNIYDITHAFAMDCVFGSARGTAMPGEGLS